MKFPGASKNKITLVSEGLLGTLGKIVRCASDDADVTQSPGRFKPPVSMQEKVSFLTYMRSPIKSIRNLARGFRTNCCTLNYLSSLVFAQLLKKVVCWPFLFYVLMVLIICYFFILRKAHARRSGVNHFSD